MRGFVIALVFLIAIGAYWWNDKDAIAPENREMAAGDVSDAGDLNAMEPSAGKTAEEEVVDEGEEEVRHMEVDAPATNEDAVKMLKDHSDEMVAAWKKKDFGTVHMDSYYLEAAATKLEEAAMVEKRDADLATISDLQTLIYKVHHAAEDEEATTIDEQLPKLKSKADAVVAAFSMK